MAKERRLYKREHVELDIDCFLPKMGDDGRNRLKCQARDISPKGAKLLVPTKVSVEDELILVLENPSSQMPLLVKGRTVWAKREEGVLETGKAATEACIEFCHIGTYGYERLGLLIKEAEANNRLAKEF